MQVGVQMVSGFPLRGGWALRMNDSGLILFQDNQSIGSNSRRVNSSYSVGENEPYVHYVHVHQYNKMALGSSSKRERERERTSRKRKWNENEFLHHMNVKIFAAGILFFFFPSYYGHYGSNSSSWLGSNAFLKDVGFSTMNRES